MALTEQQLIEIAQDRLSDVIEVLTEQGFEVDEIHPNVASMKGWMVNYLHASKNNVQVAVYKTKAVTKPTRPDWMDDETFGILMMSYHKDLKEKPSYKMDIWVDGKLVKSTRKSTNMNSITKELKTR